MYKIHPKIKWRWEGENKIMSNIFIGMNRISGEILELYKDTNDPKFVAKKLHAKYPDISYEKIHNDVLEITNKLIKWNILVPKESENYGTLPVDPFSMDRIAKYFGNRLIAPMGVACEITARCNARCLHCSIPSITEHGTDELPTECWKKIIDELADINVFGVSFTGGEPLIRKDLLDLVKYAYEKGLRITVATNCYLLDEEMIENLVTNGVDSFMVSLDGAKAETHDTFRGLPGSFEKVTSVLSSLVSEGINVGVVSVISKMNLNEVGDIIVLVKEIGVKRISLAHIRLAGRAAANRHLQPTTEDYIKLLSDLYEKDQEVTGIGIKYPNLPAKVFIESIGIGPYKKIIKQGKIGMCGAGIIGCCISPTGNVKPCDMSGPVNLGNVLETPLREIWGKSNVFEHLRTIEVKKQIPCKDCQLNVICLPGCKAQPYQIGDGGNVLLADMTRGQCFNAFRNELIKES